MRWAMLLLFLGLSSCSKPARQPTAPDSQGTKFAASEKNFETVGVVDIQRAAEAGNPDAQREFAARMLFGKGVAADPVGAMVWVERAARGGDATAALWMGRKFLNEPTDRIAAAEWFLIAKEGGDIAIRQDASCELDALNLSTQERNQAEHLSARRKAVIQAESK